MVRHSVLFKINGAKFSICVFPDDYCAWVRMLRMSKHILVRDEMKREKVNKW
jgi:hypothetical protein